MAVSYESLKVSGIEPESIVDGPGIRFAVFVQGCPHNCPGCHNPQTHPFEGGMEMSVEEIFEKFQKNPILKGITLSGGEPFCQAGALYSLAKLVHKACKDVVLYTGYVYEELAGSPDPDVQALLHEADLLIDGPFIESEKNLELSFRGSENQRVIDMKKTRSAGRVVLWEQEY